MIKLKALLVKKGRNIENGQVYLALNFDNYLWL